MATMPTFESVDDYIAAQPAAVRPVLAKVRGAIRKGLPKAEESITYKMPTYKIDGRPVLHFAAWKKHYSVYPATEEILAACKKELAPYEIDKLTIRFPYADVPATLIAKLAKLRAKEVAAYR